MAPGIVQLPPALPALPGSETQAETPGKIRYNALCVMR